MSAASRPRHPLTGASPFTGGDRIDLTAVTPMLTDRDIRILELLGEHGVLTSPQITAAFFASPHTALHRLRLLRIWGLLDRFVRYRPGFGSFPHHWVVGPVGARWLALSRDEPAPSLRAIRERRDRLASSPKLEHLLGVNQFFVDLLANSGAEQGRHLVRWWSERATANRFGRRVNPDGHGLWTAGGQTVGFFLEHDTGTEQLDRLVAKLDRYRRLRAEGGPGYPVLFWLGSRAREQNLHRRLNGKDHGSVIATATREAGLAPWQPAWKVQGNGRHRLALHELPCDHGTPGPLNPT